MLKGVFAREKGKGVIAAFVDYDDSNNCCKCSKAFAGFQAIVDGFNCAEPPKPCALFDRSHGWIVLILFDVSNLMYHNVKMRLI